MPEAIGPSRVDEVVAAVGALEERPIDEHVGVFETAHEVLRGALDPAAAGPAGTEPDSGQV